MQDFLGRDIEVGQVIVYPGRRGSSMWMQKATVSKIAEGKIGADYFVGDRLVRTALSNTANVVVVS